MKPVQIHTRDNNYQHIEVLKRNRQKRSQFKEFFVEGVRSINQLIEQKWTIQSFSFASGRKLSHWAEDILKRTDAAVFEIAAPLFEELSDKDEPSELIATVRMPDDSLSRIPTHEDFVALVCDRPTSPGNLGTLIRSADAFGVNGIVITGHATDLYDPQTIRASVGALFTVPAIRANSIAEVQAWIEGLRQTMPALQIVGTSAKGSTLLMDCNFRVPTILFLGNETTGLSAAYREMADTLAMIPMMGTSTSLNLGCAVSIALYEIQRQRSFT